jgi:hypothetical protein
MEFVMKSIVSHDEGAIREIEGIHLLMTDLEQRAEAKEQEGDYMGAYELYFKIQELSFPAGEGAVLRIKPEAIDECNWHRINQKLHQLEKTLIMNSLSINS